MERVEGGAGLGGQGVLVHGGLLGRGGAAGEGERERDEGAGHAGERILSGVRELPATIRLRPEDRGQRVERVLARALDASEGFALKLLRQEKVVLGGRALRRGERLPAGGRLEVGPLEARRGPRPLVPNPRVPLAVLHEDADVIVVEKPAGVAMHPGPGHGSDTLQNALVARFPELLELGPERGFGLVQRLDRDVSGLLVVARSARAHEALVAAFTARAVDKRYGALVKGAPRGDATRGTVDAPIDDRDAVTEWEVVERAVGPKRWVVSRLTLHPLTGRKHQLRLHLAGLGCPILGDKQHGAPGIPIAQQLGLRRVALHAEALAFVHPGTGARVAFESAWPPELARAWEHARAFAAGG